MTLSKADSSDLKLIGDAFARNELYHGHWDMLERYYRGRFSEKQWDDLKKYGRSRIWIPVARNIIDIARSIFTTSFFSAGCPIEILKKGSTDQDKANVITTMTKHYYDKTKPQKNLSRAFWSALTLRLGIVLTYWDRDRVITKDISVKDLAFDYEATDIDDVQYLAYRFYESGNTVKDKIRSKFYDISLPEFFGHRVDDRLMERFKIEEIVKRSGEKWQVKTFCNGKLLRRRTFERNPFQYGYAIDEFKYMDQDYAKNQILVYGGSMVMKVREIQDEINLKRNQKNDIQEEKINPTYFVDDTATVNPFDLRKGPGQAIKVTGKLSGLQARQPPNEFDLNNDLATLTKQDLEDGSGLNNIMRGGTSPSDRRSAKALTIVNANSSPRIEDMIMLISDTLFHHWAKQFVYLVVKHAPDEVIHKVTERDDYPLGRIGKRQGLEYDVTINFGATINKEAKIADIVSLVEMLLQNPNANPDAIQGMIKEIVTLKLGENTNLKTLFETTAAVNAPEPAQLPPRDPAQAREAMLIAQGGV